MGQINRSCYSVAKSCLTLGLQESKDCKTHGLQYARLPCPSQAPEVCSNSCPLSWWCHPTISSSIVTFSSCLQSFPSIGVFSIESAVRIRWSKYWSFSFSISPSNEYWGLISFRIDWLDLCSLRDSQESSPTPQFKTINSSVLSLLFGPILTSLHDYIKKLTYWKFHFITQSVIQGHTSLVSPVSLLERQTGSTPDLLSQILILKGDHF